MRRKLLVGNWKMNMSMSATKSFFADLQNNLNKDGIDPSNIDLAVGAPFTLLSTVGTENPTIWRQRLKMCTGRPRELSLERFQVQC